jgi:hypothetical protein
MIFCSSPQNVDYHIFSPLRGDREASPSGEVVFADHEVSCTDATSSNSLLRQSRNVP